MRDRTGELIEDDDTDPDRHACDSGWLDRDTARPCLTCKPWLRHRRPPTANELAAARATTTPTEDT